HQAGHAAAQVIHILIDDLSGGRVAQGGGVKGGAAVDRLQSARQLPQLGVGVFLHDLTGPFDEGGSGAVGFKAALPAAGTQPAVVLNDKVAHFHAGVVEAGIQLAVEDSAAAHTGTQGNGDHGLAALAGAGGKFAQSGGIGVVLQVDLFIQPLL